MSKRVDDIVYAALEMVNSMTPEDRSCLAMMSCAGVVDDKQLHLRKLVIAVEAANLAEGEQVFTLLRRDPAAPDTIRFWAMKAASLARGVSNAPKCDAARRLAESWAEWQRDNLTKVKVPD